MIRFKIKDYENIKDADIIIKGLTAVVGESNNGKTAGYNAAKTLTYNIQGKGYIRKVDGKPVKTGCVVDAHLSEGVRVVFQKTDSAMYDMLTQGQVKQKDEPPRWDKVGRGKAPEDVRNMLNMEPLDVEGTEVNLNYMDQLAPPLLKTFSEYSLYKTAVKSHDGDKIKQAINLVDVDEKELEVKSNEKKIAIRLKKEERLKEETKLEIYSELDQLEQDFQTFVKDLDRLPHAMDFHSRHSELSFQLIRSEEKLGDLKPVDKIVPAMNQLGALLDKVTLAETSLGNLLGVQGRENILVKILDILKPVDKIVETIQGFEPQLGEISGFYKRMNEIHTSINKMSGREQLFSPLNKDLFERGVYQYQKDGEKLKNAMLFNEKMNDISVEICHVGEKLKSVDLVYEVEATLEEIKSCSKTIQELNVFLQKLKDHDVSYQYKEQELELVNQEIKTAQETLKAGKCSTCGSKVDKEKNMEINKELVQRISALQVKKQKFETEKEVLDQQKTKLENEIKGAGYDPETLPKVIEETSERLKKFEAAALPVVEKMEKALSDAENGEFAGDPDEPNFEA